MPTEYRNPDGSLITPAHPSTLPGLPPLGGVPNRPANLDKWFAALEASDTTPVDIVVIADSLAEVGNNIDRPWPWVMSDVLSRYMQEEPPIGYLTAASGEGPNFDFHNGVDYSEGFGLQGVRLTNGQVAHHTGRMTHVTVLHTTQAVSGTCQVRDGGPAGTLIGTLNGVGTASKSNLTHFTLDPSDEIAPGIHWIHLTVVAGGANEFRLEGAYFYQNNFDAGIRVWPAARSGAISSTPLLTTGMAIPLIQNLNPKLIILATGANDTLQPEGYDVLMRGLVDGVKALTLNPEPDIALWVPYLLPPTRFTRTHAAEAQKIATDEALGLIDASVDLPDMSVPGTNLKYDTVHPSSEGSKLIGRHAALVLGGDQFRTLLHYTETERRTRNEMQAAISPYAPFYVTGKVYDNSTSGLARTFVTGVAGTMSSSVFVPATTFTVDQFGLHVVTGVASALARAFVYAGDAANHDPGTLLYASANLDCATTNTVMTEAVNFTFERGVVYWLGVHHSSTAAIGAVAQGALRSLGSPATAGTTSYSVALRTGVTFGSGTPAAFGAVTAGAANAPQVRFRIA